MKNDPLFKYLSAAILVGVIVSASLLSGCVYPATVVAAPPPPPPRVEVAGLSPGPGYAWVRGHWAWRYGRYVWVHGHWAVL